MKNVALFFKHYFLWHKKFYILFLFLIVMSRFLPEISPHKLSMSFSFILYLVAFMFVVIQFIQTSFLVVSFDSNFSWKYFRSLPFTRVQSALVFLGFGLLESFVFILWYIVTPTFKPIPNPLFSVILVFIFFTKKTHLLILITNGRNTDSRLFVPFWKRMMIGSFPVAIYFLFFLPILFVFNENEQVLIRWTICCAIAYIVFHFCFIGFSWKHEWVTYSLKTFHLKRDGISFLLIVLIGIFLFYATSYSSSSLQMYGENELFELIANNDENGLDQYLRKNKPLNIVGKHNFTPLAVAAHEGNFNFYKKLLKAGVVYNGEVFEGTPGSFHNGMDLLFLAVDGESVTLVEELLRKGMNVNSFNPKNGYPLINLAVMKCNPLLTELLIKNIVNLNVSNKKGETPVHVATRADCLSTLIALKLAGADFSSKNIEGKDALDIAKEDEVDTKVIQYLESLQTKH